MRKVGSVLLGLFLLGLNLGVPLSPFAALLVGAGLGFLLRAVVSP